MKLVNIANSGRYINLIFIGTKLILKLLELSFIGTKFRYL